MATGNSTDSSITAIQAERLGNPCSPARRSMQNPTRLSAAVTVTVYA